MGNAMSDILNELLTDIISLGEATPPNKKTSAPKTNAADIKPRNAKFTSGGRWYSDANFTNYVGRIEKGKWVAATRQEKQAEREKRKIPTKQIPVKTSIKPASQTKSPEVSTSLLSALDIGNPDLNKLIKVLKAGNPETIQSTMSDLGVSVSDTGKLIFVKDKKRIDPYGKSRKQKARLAATELEKELQKYKIPFSVQVKTNPLLPTNVIPKTNIVPFQATIDEQDRSVTFNGVKYQYIDDTKTFVENQINVWKNTPDGKNASREEENEFTIKMVTVANAINQRNILLRKLLSTPKTNLPENVAVFDTPEKQTEYYDLLETTLNKNSSTSTKKKLTAIFPKLKQETDVNKSEQILLEILQAAQEDDKLSKFLPALVENLTAVLEMKRGRTVIIPMRDNFEASDVISLSQDVPTTATPSELIKQISSIYTGVSVKLGKGGASSMMEKTKQSIFYPNHKNTVETLLLLSSQVSPTGSIFDKDKNKRDARIKEIIGVLEKNRKEICKYYGLDPKKISSANELISVLGYGSALNCGPGGIPQRAKKPAAPLDRPEVDSKLWKITFAAQYAWAAIYNTRVASQAFASHTWTTKKLIQVDGLDKQAKQIPQGYKQLRGEGKFTQPDALVSFNKPVASRADIRNGNPCTQ